MHIGVKLLAAISACLTAHVEKIVFTALHNSRREGHALVSLFHITVDREGPHVNSIINGVECCGLSLPMKCCTRLLIFIDRAENSTSLSSCSQSLHFEQVDNAYPRLNNGTNVGALSNLKQFIEASRKAQVKQ